MKNLRFLKVSMSVTVLALLAVFGLAGCGGGGGGGGRPNTGNTEGETSAIQPVSASGEITTPSSIVPVALKVVSGIDSQSVNSNGSFSIKLNKDNTQLVMAVDSSDNPVLMSMAVNAQSGSQVAMDVQTTAEALIYLSPGVAQSNSIDAQTVMGYIKSLPETTVLANLLTVKLAANPNILSSSPADTEITNAISSALQALINKVKSTGGLSSAKSLLGRVAALKRNAFSSGTSCASTNISPLKTSGLLASFDDCTKTLSIENMVKRYVDFYVVSPSPRFLFTADSVDMLEYGTKSYLSDTFGADFSSIGTTADSLISEYNATTNVTIKAYGLGFYDYSNVWNNLDSNDKERLVSPVIRTAVYDIIEPVVSGLLGVDCHICAGNVLQELTQEIMVNYKDAILYTLQTGNYQDFTIVVIGAAYDRLLSNDHALLWGLAADCLDLGFWETTKAILTAVSRVETVLSIGDVIGAATSISLTKAVETFTISTAGSAPSSPTSVSAIGGDSQTTIGWNSVSGADSYNIYWSTSPGVSKTTGTKVSNVTSPYTHTGLTNGTTYYYVVTAVNNYGESGESSEVSAMPKGSGMLQGYVKDAVTKSGLSGTTVKIYDSSGNLITSTTSDSSGVYTANLTTGTYSLNVTKTDYISENISNVVIQENVTTTVETVLQVSTTYSGTGAISGTIKNALDGTGVSGVSINFRSGINVATGTVIATATTDSYGGYSITTLNAGNYTGEAVKSGFTTAYFTITAIGGQTNYNQDATITPILSSGETRVVLTWGSSPSDLDSHLTGPISGSTSRFHVYWYDQGSSTWSPYAALDVDDVWSYGPETITISQQFDGVYRYSVRDYSNGDSTSSTALSNSGATVKVYRGSTLVATFNVPVNQGGTLWTVFELSGDTVTPINEMSYVSSSSAVQSPSLRSASGPISHSDAPLMRNLPEKQKRE